MHYPASARHVPRLPDSHAPCSLLSLLTEPDSHGFRSTLTNVLHAAGTQFLPTPFSCDSKTCAGWTRRSSRPRAESWPNSQSEEFLGRRVAKFSVIALGTEHLMQCPYPCCVDSKVFGRERNAHDVVSLIIVRLRVAHRSPFRPSSPAWRSRPLPPARPQTPVHANHTPASSDWNNRSRSSTGLAACKGTQITLEGHSLC